MSQDGKSGFISGQTAGFVTIAIGFAVLIANYLTNNWILVVPVALIEVGIYGMSLGAFGEFRGKQANGQSRWGTDPGFTIFWGSLVAVVGALWLVNAAWPNNIPALASVFMVWLGIAVMMLTRRKNTNSRIW